LHFTLFARQYVQATLVLGVLSGDMVRVRSTVLPLGCNCSCLWLHSWVQLQILARQANTFTCMLRSWWYDTQKQQNGWVWQQGFTINIPRTETKDGGPRDAPPWWCHVTWWSVHLLTANWPGVEYSGLGSDNWIIGCIAT